MTNAECSRNDGHGRARCSIVSNRKVFEQHRSTARRAGLVLSSVVIAARPSRVCKVILCAAVLLLAAATPAGFGFLFAAAAAFGTILEAALCRVFRAAPENPGAIWRQAFRSPLSGRAPPPVS